MPASASLTSAIVSAEAVAPSISRSFLYHW
jgi:hypothetical protein